MEAVSTLAIYALASLCMQGLWAIAPIMLGIGFGKLVEWIDEQMLGRRP